MARAFFERATSAHVASSAGLRPGAQIDPLIVAAMSEVGIDLRDCVPHALTPTIVSEADIIVRSIRPDPDNYEWPAGPRYIDWSLPLPANENAPTIDEVRRLRDAARAHALALAHELAFDELRPVSSLLVRAALPFGFCGGWALELFAATHGLALGRSHSDVDVAVLRNDLPRWVSKLASVFRIARDGGLHDAQPDEVASTSAHEIHVDVGGVAIELLVNDVDDDAWVYRRDRRVRRSLSQTFVAAEFPFLAPEIVLLFKAKTPREKDTADFAAILPLLDAERREWLRQALGVMHPDHPWSASLRP